MLNLKKKTEEIVDNDILAEMYPVIYKYTRCLLDSNNCDNIIKSLNMIQPSDDPLFATLAIDAAKFKNIKGKEIKSSLKKCILLD